MPRWVAYHRRGVPLQPPMVSEDATSPLVPPWGARPSCGCRVTIIILNLPDLLPFPKIDSDPLYAAC